MSQKLYWKHSIGGTVVQFDNTPFSLGEKRLLDCQFGVQYKQSKLSTSSKRVYLQGSRKKGCSAQVEVSQFKLYPEFSVQSLLSPDFSQKKIRRIKEENLKSLRDTFATSGTEVKACHKYYVKLPTEEAHHKWHPTKGLMGLSQRVHPELIAKIQELVVAGIIDEVQKLLNNHVHHYNNVFW